MENTKFASDLDVLASLGGHSEPAETTPAVVASKSTGIAGTTSSVEDRALQLLGSGIAVTSVASALGVTEARISQLLADEVFANKVATLRYERLQSHNVRDESYDNLEDKLLVKLDRAVPLMVKPETVLKALQVVNGAKRRGQSSPDQVINSQNVVNILLPKVVVNKFVVNANNQVIAAGEQELLTMPSGSLLKQTEVRQKERNGELLEHSTQEDNNHDTTRESQRKEGSEDSTTIPEI